MKPNKLDSNFLWLSTFSSSLKGEKHSEKNEEKTVGPDTLVQFAGIDSVLQEARLPEDKLQTCHTLIHILLMSEGAPITHWSPEIYLLGYLTRSSFPLSSH